MTDQYEKPKGFMDWLKESVTVKLVFIGMLIIVLLIPSSLISSLISERAGRQNEMMQDVSDKWSGNQLIQGPVLIIPYKKHVKYIDTANKETSKDAIQSLYVLPDNLHIKAVLSTQILHRGIFDAVVYTTRLIVSGNFSKADLNALSINADQLFPEKAKMAFSISDLKGLKTNPVVKVANQSPTAEPAFNNVRVFSNGLQAAVNLTSLTNEEVSFN